MICIRNTHHHQIHFQLSLHIHFQSFFYCTQVKYVFVLQKYLLVFQILLLLKFGFQNQMMWFLLLLNMKKLQVYQITKGGCEYRFMNYAYSKSRIHAADYSSVYIANLPADYDLDRCFQEFNAPNRPLRYHMCSLSTSDIVVTTKNGKETAYYVDSIGFKDVSHLLPELHEVEAQRQIEQVQDEPER